MGQITFSDVKVHNEIALCRITDMEVKKEIESLFLKSRISYFEKWERPNIWKHLFGDHREHCVLCVNNAQIEKAEEIIRTYETDNRVDLILQRVHKIYF